MKLVVHIDMDNAAFGEMPGYEVGRILQNLAERTAAFGEFIAGVEFKAYDINGNLVGKAEFVED